MLRMPSLLPRPVDKLHRRNRDEDEAAERRAKPPVRPRNLRDGERGENLAYVISQLMHCSECTLTRRGELRRRCARAVCGARARRALWLVPLDEAHNVFKGARALVVVYITALVEDDGRIPRDAKPLRDFGLNRCVDLGDVHARGAVCRKVRRDFLENGSKALAVRAPRGVEVEKPLVLCGTLLKVLLCEGDHVFRPENEQEDAGHHRAGG